MSHTNLIERLELHAKVQPKACAFTFIKSQNRQSSITYEELQTKAKAIAYQLNCKLQKGQRVLLVFPPGLDFIVAFLGCLYANVIAVPAMPPVSEESTNKLIAITDDCQPKLLLTNKQLWNKLTTIKFGVRLPFSNKLLKNNDSNYKSPAHWNFLSIPSLIISTKKKPLPTSYHLDPPLASSIAFLQYTSGSTGSPKGVVITHENLMCNLQIIHTFSKSTKHSITVSWLPPYHDLGLIGCILESIYTGYHCYLFSALDFLKNPALWLQAISKYRATRTAAPNFALDYCARKIANSQKKEIDLSSLQYICIGGEPAKECSLTRFYEAFKSCNLNYTSLSPAYGLAEATVGVSATFIEDNFKCLTVDKNKLQNNQICEENKLSSNSQLLVSYGECYLKTVIVDPVTYHERKPNEVGEVWLSGKSVTKGYWNNPELTKRNFHAKLANSKDNQSYLRSGDLGFLDKNNHLYITGRLSDVIIIQGKNIYPQDIESAIDNCHPAIRPGCNAAFSDTVNGLEEIIVCSEIKVPLDKIDVHELYESIEQAVIQSSGYIPYCIMILKPKTSFKTSSGKIQRKKTKAAYKDNQLKTIASYHWQQNASIHRKFIEKLILTPEKQRENVLRKEINTIIAEVLFIDTTPEFSNNTELQYLGIDSLMSMEIWKRLQALSGQEHTLPKTLLLECTSISRLCEYLKSNVLVNYFPAENTYCSSDNNQSIEPPKINISTTVKAQKNLTTGHVETIFMTGATGVLGSYLIKLILENTNITIHCLIRASSQQHGFERLKASLLTYGINEQALAKLESRVTLHLGYLESETLGLNPNDYETICLNTDLTIHAAANLSLQDSYEELYATNVAGTQNIINLCLQTSSMRLIYVSSYAVMGDIQFTPNRTFSEQDLDLNQGFEDMGYQKTKFEAEHLVRKTSGLKWQITRVGDLFGDSKSGAYPLKDNPNPGLFYDIFKTMIESQVALATPLYFDITPVDYAASALLDIALNQHDLKNTYHITNPHHLTFAEVMQLLNDCGYPVELISAEEYINRVYTNHIRVNGKVYKSMTTKLAKFRTQYLLSDGGTAVDCLWTQQQLKESGIECPRIDEQLLNTLLDYCFESGYICRAI